MPDQGLQLYPLLGSLKRLCRIVFLLIAPAFLLACSQMAGPSAVVPDDVPRRAAVADVPLIKQEDYYCGPASLAMVLQWAGMDVTQAEIAAQAFSPGATGTYLADMVGTARRRGQLAVPISSLADLLGEIAADHPVIIFQNLGLSWAPTWHYAVAVGYDLKDDQIFLNSGELDRMTSGKSSAPPRRWREPASRQQPKRFMQTGLRDGRKTGFGRSVLETRDISAAI